MERGEAGGATEGAPVSRLLPWATGAPSCWVPLTVPGRGKEAGAPARGCSCGRWLLGTSSLSHMAPAAGERPQAQGQSTMHMQMMSGKEGGAGAGQACCHSRGLGWDTPGGRPSERAGCT